MHVAKVLVYVTHRGRLLVLRHPDSTDAGAQVPGGSVEPGEELAEAALREAREETGLADLVIERFLGMATYVPRVLPGPPHLRHFFHASLTSNVPDSWDHVEATPSTGGPPVRLRLQWEALEAVRLDWEMDAFLSELTAPRDIPPPAR